MSAVIGYNIEYPIDEIIRVNAVQIMNYFRKSIINIGEIC
jgi:hypothetical protein